MGRHRAARRARASRTTRRWATSRSATTSMVLQNKVIEPLFEARTDFRIGSARSPSVSAQTDALPETSRAVGGRRCSRTSEDPYVSAPSPSTRSTQQPRRLSPRGHREAAPRRSRTSCSPPRRARMDVYYDDSGGIRPGAARLRGPPPEALRRQPGPRETSRCSWRTCARASASTTSSPTRQWIQQYYEPLRRAEPRRARGARHRRRRHGGGGRTSAAASGAA